jgi:hypothetical protein
MKSFRMVTAGGNAVEFVFSLYLSILNDLFCLSVFLTVTNTGNWQRRSKIPIVPGAPHGVKNALFIPSTGFHPTQLRCRIGDRRSATLSSMTHLQGYFLRMTDRQTVAKTDRSTSLAENCCVLCDASPWREGRNVPANRDLNSSAVYYEHDRRENIEIHMLNTNTVYSGLYECEIYSARFNRPLVVLIAADGGTVVQRSGSIRVTIPRNNTPLNTVPR